MPDRSSPAGSARNLAVLVALQALLSTANSTVIALGGLIGAGLAGDPALATVPITSWVIGGALTTFGASHLMRRFGRRAGFSLGALIGLGGTGLALVALARASFALFVGATFVLGGANAFGQYYRFAAADAAPVERRARAIAWVLAGGLIGGVLGPSLTRATRDLFATPYLGAYLPLAGTMLLTLVVVQLLELPRPVELEALEPARPLRQVAGQPAFIVAVLASALGFGVMNFLMTATPLAMTACGHPFDAATTVISWHVVGMYAPSFVTGDLIKRFGVGPILAAGVALNGVCVAIALAGVAIANFWAALVILGVGWNFLYVGGTSLLTTTYRPAEKASAQGLHDMAVFAIMVVSSISSGLVLARGGWSALAWSAVPPLGIVALALLMLGRRERRSGSSTGTDTGTGAGTDTDTGTG